MSKYHFRMYMVCMLCSERDMITSTNSCQTNLRWSVPGDEATLSGPASKSTRSHVKRQSLETFEFYRTDMFFDTCDGDRISFLLYLNFLVPVRKRWCSENRAPGNRAPGNPAVTVRCSSFLSLVPVQIFWKVLNCNYYSFRIAWHVRVVRSMLGSSHWASLKHRCIDFIQRRVVHSQTSLLQT